MKTKTNLEEKLKQLKKLTSELADNLEIAHGVRTCKTCGHTPEKLYRQVKKLFDQQQSIEIIVCSAIKLKNGTIVRGHRHNHCIHAVMDIETIKGHTQGFITSKNRFVDRKEAHQIHYGNEGTLYSEDLY